MLSRKSPLKVKSHQPVTIPTVSTFQKNSLFVVTEILIHFKILEFVILDQKIHFIFFIKKLWSISWSWNSIFGSKNPLFCRESNSDPRSKNSFFWIKNSIFCFEIVIFKCWLFCVIIILIQNSKIVSGLYRLGVFHKIKINSGRFFNDKLSLVVTLIWRCGSVICPTDWIISNFFFTFLDFLDLDKDF